MKILHYSELPLGGFAGLKEKRMVTDERIFGLHKHPKAFNGIGNFVYLADANFLPHGETGMHPHREIDVISVMVEGRISHAGSLEHGQQLDAGFTQVQRAGGKGFFHNEINPDSSENQMIQLWVLPDNPGEPAGYQVFEPEVGKLQQVYGGDRSQTDRFHSKTSIAVANLIAGQSIHHWGDAMLYLSKGKGTLNGDKVELRTLFHLESGIEFTASEDAQLIVIYPS
ncbi:pirin family protein [Thalassotalea mangrovi]|uniref:Pilus assembly protein n=1 Tax=Thalassotalea mangrovi TaxID=2572245 RepID=A0A4U1B7W0_9GAMM|nr:pirin family protein [Thalassotalea mangrovi]TKB46589.1 pilus assembly protein [Thalassotalea mangrovi]